MATYTDFFMRPNLKATNNDLPTPPPRYNSPDLIPQPAAVSGYQTVLASSASYASSPGQNLVLGQANEIYVRAMNYGSATSSGTVNLWATPCALINWPSQWAQPQNQIPTDVQTSSGTWVYSNPLPATAAGQVAVAENPFVWIPEPPPSGSSHYCLIAQMITPAHPNPIPGLSGMTYENLGQLLSDNPGFGWRNVGLVPGDAPTWTYQVGLSVPSSTPTTETITIELQCSGMPTGGAMAFTCSKDDSDGNPIVLEKTTITDPDIVAGIDSVLAPGFAAALTVSYWASGTTPPNGATINVVAEYNPGSGTTPAASEPRPIEPQTPVEVGRFTYCFQS